MTELQPVKVTPKLFLSKMKGEFENKQTLTPFNSKIQGKDWSYINFNIFFVEYTGNGLKSHHLN